MKKQGGEEGGMTMNDDGVEIGKFNSKKKSLSSATDVADIFMRSVLHAQAPQRYSSLSNDNNQHAADTTIQATLDAL